MKVPFVDLKASYLEHRAEIDAALQDVLEKTAFIKGPKLEAFEEAFARYVGARHCVGVSSGTEALKLALEALGVGPGDEVVIPANTFVATAFAATALGAVPRFVDCEEETLLLDVDRVAEAVTERTKAILPVHLYGRVLDLGPLRRLGLPLVEDAAQAHGAERDGLRAGAQGLAAGFSFYPGKNLGAFGDAGAVVTSDDALAERVSLLRTYGERVKYEHLIRGHNARMDALQAAILQPKLERLDDANERRREAARFYDESLRVRHLPYEAGHVYHLYVIRVRNRETLQARLAEEGVAAQIHYPIPLHLQPCFKDLGYGVGSFPRAERAAQEVLSLPIYPQITREQLEHVVEVVNREAESA